MKALLPMRVSLGLALALPFCAQAQDPAWWLTKGVYPVQYHGRSDYNAANVGQLKNIAVAAYEHLLEVPGGIGDLTPPPDLNQPVSPTNPAGIGWRLQQLVSAWVVLNPDGTIARDPNDNRRILNPAAPQDDFKAVKQGQVKAVAKLFHLRLNEIYAPFSHPRAWTDDDNPATPADAADDQNHAMINLGQLKHAFYFNVFGDFDRDGISDLDELAAQTPDLPGAVPIDPFNFDSDGDHFFDGDEDATNRHLIDSDRDGISDIDDLDNDNDGMSDLEEIALGFDPHDALDGTQDADGDGISNADEVIAGSDPFDPFNANAPSFTVLAGGGQQVLSAHVTPNPIVVEVRSPGGTLLINVPVTITAPGTARVHASRAQCQYVGQSQIVIRTGPTGTVTFFVRGSDDEGGHPIVLACQGAVEIVTVTTNAALAAPEVTNFHVTYPGGATRPTLNWQYTPPAGGAVSIEIFSSVDDENWIKRATLPSSATTWSEPNLFGATYVNYRVYTVWND